MVGFDSKFKSRRCFEAGSQFLSKGRKKLIGASQALGPREAFERIQNGGCGLDSHIRLNEESLQIIPCFIGDLRCTK